MPTFELLQKSSEESWAPLIASELSKAADTLLIELTQRCFVVDLLDFDQLPAIPSASAVYLSHVEEFVHQQAGSLKSEQLRTWFRALAVCFVSTRRDVYYLSSSLGIDAQFLPLPVPVLDSLPSKQLGGIATAAGPETEFLMHRVLGVLEQSFPQLELTWLVSEQEQPAAMRRCEEFPGARVRLEIGRTPERWREISSSSLLCLHGAASASRGSELLTLISMSQGKAVALPALGLADHLPSDCVYKLSPGFRFEAELAALLGSIARGVVPLLASQNRWYCQQNHHPAQIVADAVHLLADWAEAQYSSASVVNNSSASC